MNLRTAGLALLLVCPFACVCGPGHGSGGGGGGSGGGSNSSGGGGGLDLDAGVHTQCTSSMGMFTDDAVIDAILAGMEGPFPEGISEIPLSGDGCFRLVRNATGGQLSRLSINRYSGQYDIIIDGGSVTLGEKPDLLLVDWAFSSPGSDGYTLTVDADLDGKPESSRVEQYDANGITMAQAITYQPGTTTVLGRTTITFVASGMMHQKEERVVGTTLTTLFDSDIVALQKQIGCALTGSTDPDKSDPATCADTVAMLRAKLKAAVRAGLKCLLDVAGITEATMKLAKLITEIDTKTDFICYRNQNYLAQVDVSRPGGRIPVQINADLGTCTTAFQQSTLFHEFMHLTYGGHDPSVESAFKNTINPDLNQASLQYAYTDPMRACENFCFGTVKTRCSCAACLKTTACDGRCENYDSCSVGSADAGYTMSQAVGAICDKGAQSTIFVNMAACASACSGGTCKSKSLSCKDTCN